MNDREHLQPDLLTCRDMDDIGRLGQIKGRLGQFQSRLRKIQSRLGKPRTDWCKSKADCVSCKAASKYAGAHLYEGEGCDHECIIDRLGLIHLNM